MGLYDQLEGMDEILDDFVVEVNEILEQLNEDILVLENYEDQDVDLVNRVFRAYHTIKGTSGFLGFMDCTEVAHNAEDILNTIRNGKLTPNSEIVDVLFETVDWFSEFVKHVKQRTEDYPKTTDIIEDIKGLTGKNGQVKEKKVEKTTKTKKSEMTNGLPSNINEELLSEFLSESDELLENISNDLVTIEKKQNDFNIEQDSEIINNIFRAFHTLKGNSGIIQQDQMSSIAHKSEDILSEIRNGALKPNSQIIDVLLFSIDWFKSALKALRNNETSSINADLETQLLSVLNGKNSAKTDTNDKQTKTKKKTPSSVPSIKKRDQTIRVGVDRLDKLLNLAGELVLGRNRLSQVTGNFSKNNGNEKSLDDLNSVSNTLGIVTTEIQESIMQLRMLPISNVFRKFPRVVRDLAREQQKKIDLVLSGEDTELDRSVIESISDPLVHLLRNSIDHGIESPKTREKHGKSSTGIVSLSAFQEGNNIVIEIKDDGAGINIDRVKEKAVEKNILTPEEAKSIRDQDAINLIFRPGFSTAKTVTDVSGRGVGMDVVKSNISRLNGVVSVETTKGKDTTFTIKLPLTLTILTGMVVRSVDQIYIIPLISISEILKLESDMVFSIQGNEMFRLHDSVTPLIRLNDLLNLSVKDDANSDQYIVVVNVAEKRLGLVVSEMIGQEETVVKPLGQTHGKTPHIAGATIRGDGRVCLILDVPEIVKIQQSKCSK